jgi:predicted dehydrogenase
MKNIFSHLDFSRRKFIRQMGKIVLTIPALSLTNSLASKNTIPAVTKSPQNVQENNSRVLGIALVGLGKYSSEQLAPALQETKLCKLKGIVTGSPHKAGEWQRKYDIPSGNIYSYQEFDRIKDNPAIDIVYVVLPNSMHAAFVIRAAQAGKHVICEKPMGISVKECENMIKACKEADRQLSIGYRLHFEPHNLTMAELSRNKTHGKVVKITARHGMDIEPGVWRLDKELAGGGPLMDVGIYCVQAAIYTLGENPVAVTAQEGKKTDLKRFSEVEQSLKWQMVFPSGAIAECETSYAEEQNHLRVQADTGWFELEPAYAYKGIKGKTSLGKMKLPEVNQQALQMDDFARCIQQNKPTRVPGEMGLRDVKIMMAVYEAASNGKRVELGDL